MEADILECEGKYQDAIDAIESIPDRRDFAEKFTMELSFLELRMNTPAKAVKRCKALGLIRFDGRLVEGMRMGCF
jgi:hypothetical protein